MREKRPLSPIHSFRLEYNALVKKLHKLNEGDNSSGKQWQIDDMIKKYPIIPTEMGKVCQICGMNNFEKNILCEQYAKIIHDLKVFLDQK